MQMAFGKRAFFGWVAAPDGSVWWFANPPRRHAGRAGPQLTPASWRAELLELFAGDAMPAAAMIRATDEIARRRGTPGTCRACRSGATSGRVLIGDAAHAVSPSSGQGASMALEDAVTLGRCLRARRTSRRRWPTTSACAATGCEKVVAYGRRSGSTKTAGPVGAGVRDALTPLVMRLLYRKGDPQAWILDHRV